MLCWRRLVSLHFSCALRRSGKGGYKMTEKIEIITNIFTCVGIIVALCEFYFFRRSTYADYERNKKQATIDVYMSHYNDIIQLNHQIYLRYQRNRIPVNEIKDDHEFRQILKQYLNWMEWISTGINTNIYDINVFDRLYGKAMVRLYDQLEDYIRYRRNELKEWEVYRDYELLVMELKQIHMKMRVYEVNMNAEVKHTL